MLLQPLEQDVGLLGQASEAEAAVQVGAEEPQGREVRRLLEVLAVLVQPQAHHRQQRTAGEEREERRSGETRNICSRGEQKSKHPLTCKS